MKNTTLTPTPWVIRGNFASSSVSIGYISTEDDQSYGMQISIADVFGDNLKQDAQLISAAPELLAALEGALEYLTPDTALYKKAVAAIAKARGEL
jgi:hypothetical protein